MLLTALCMCAQVLDAQVITDARKRHLCNLPTFDRQRLHFGFLIGFNCLDFHIDNSGARTAENGYVARYADVLSLQPGMNLGIVNDLLLVDCLNLRVLPGISFGERIVDYIDERGELIGESAKTKSTFLDLPILLKYSAFRLNDIKPFVVGGTSLRYDLAKDKTSYLKTRPFDVYADLGAGFDFYLTYFRLSVELRASIGLRDVYSSKQSDEQDSVPYWQAISGMRSRWYGITFYFE